MTAVSRHDPVLAISASLANLAIAIAYAKTYLLKVPIC
jgi:hypothetical protein